jgi:hypothetical protein
MPTLTPNELATRVLHKLKVLDPSQAASASKLAKALEKLSAAHYALRSQGLVRWTLQDVPEEVQEAYVMLAASLAADDYGAPANPGWGQSGLRMVQTYVHVPIGGPSCAESF